MKNKTLKFFSIFSTLLLVAFLIIPIQVQAQTKNDPPFIGENEDNFPKIKEFVQLSIVERQKILDKEKDCVNKSQNKPELKQCFINAKEARRDMGKKLKEFKENK